jgi:hypothetical protein
MFLSLLITYLKAPNMKVGTQIFSEFSSSSSLPTENIVIGSGLSKLRI